MSEVAAPAAPAATPSSAPSTPSATPASTPSAAPTSASSTNTPAGVSSSQAGTAPNSKFADAPDGAPKTETPAEKRARILKLKVDGAEEDANVDAMSDEQLALELQMARAARKRMQESAELKKRVGDIVGWIQKDPFEALKQNFDIDLDRLAEERLANRLKEQMLPEPEREKMALQRKLQEYEAREAERQAAMQQEKEAALARQVEEELVRDFKSTLAEYGLPHTRETIAIMAEIQLARMNEGIELTPAQMAHEVRERLGGINKNVISGLKGKALVEYLGNDVVKEIIKYSVDQVKAAQQSQPPSPSPTINNDLEDNRPKRNMQSFSQVKKYFRT